MENKDKKKFMVSTWVEVEVFAEVEAKNKESALRKAKKLENCDFTENMWASNVQDKGFEIEEVK